MTLPPQYTESRIAAALARNTFAGSLVVVDNCYGIGSECDLLVVTRNLMAVDVEIKISVADLKRDRDKDKWIDRRGYSHSTRHPLESVPRPWPRGAHKHYYVIPDPIWRDDLLEHCQPKSGVIKVKISDDGGLRSLVVMRRVQANPEAKALTHAQVLDIARLASLRMWDAYDTRARAMSRLSQAQAQAQGAG